MLTTIVNASAQAAQVFFLIAVIAFVILGIIAAVARDLNSFVLATGLACVSAGLLWFA